MISQIQTLMWLSFPVHVACFNEERLKAWFPWGNGWRSSKGTLPVVCFKSPARISNRESKGWSFPSYDGAYCVNGAVRSANIQSGGSSCEWRSSKSPGFIGSVFVRIPNADIIVPGHTGNVNRAKWAEVDYQFLIRASPLEWIDG